MAEAIIWSVINATQSLSLGFKAIFSSFTLVTPGTVFCFLYAGGVDISIKIHVGETDICQTSVDVCRYSSEFIPNTLRMHWDLIT